MTVPSLTPLDFLGASNGGYRSALAAAQSHSLGSPNPADLGAESRQSRAYAIARGTIKDAGIRAGEIIGWRAWQLTSDGILRSMVMDTPWLPGQPLASEEVFASHGGIHSFKSIEQAQEEYGCYAFGRRKVALGEVALWGEVIEHSKGYRAEYAAVHSIKKIIGGSNKRGWRYWRPCDLEILRETYGLAATAA